MSFTGDRIAWSSSSLTVVTGSVAGSVVLGHSQDRAGLKFFNNSNQDVLIGYHGAEFVVSPSRHCRRITSASFVEEPKPWTGKVSVVWNTIPSTGSLFITEMF